MKKKKQNFNAFSISVIALLVVAILGTGVYAYYQTQMSATGDMHAKAWVFTAKGNDKELSDTFSDTIANLQPGASGQYKITVDATGTEVDLDYLVDIAYATNSEQITNLKFYSDAEHTTELSSTNKIRGTILATDSARTKDVYIYYAWPYDSGNQAADTADAGKTVSFNLTVTGVQKNPNA